MQLADLLNKWNKYEPQNCFPFKASKRHLYAIKLGNKSHTTIDPIDPKVEDFARLQRAVQYAIVDRGVLFSIQNDKTGKHLAVIYTAFGAEIESENTEPAIALLAVYVDFLGQSEIKVEAIPLATENAAEVLKANGIDVSQGAGLVASDALKKLMQEGKL